MRIAFVTTRFVTEGKFDGGPSNYLNKICLSLTDLGHKPIVFVVSTENQIIFHNGIEVHRVTVTSRWLNFLSYLTLKQFSRSLFYIYQSWKLNREVKRAHRQNPFDLIQYASGEAVGLFRLKGVPTVVRISSHQPSSRKADEKPHFSRDRRCFIWLEKMAAAKANGVFAPSRIIADIVQKEIQKPVSVIESPVMLDVKMKDERLYRNLLAGRDYLLFFGALRRLKGVDVIAEIIHKLLKEHPQLLFVFIGQDTRYQPGIMMSDYLRQKAGPHQKKVVYFGPVPHEQLYPVLDNALAVVLPSRIDNLPNTCLEAMAHKKVVVGTRGASFEQLIDDGVSGFLCEPGNPVDLLKTIEKVLSLTPEQKEAVGERAAQRVNTAEPEKVVARLVDFFRKIIEKMNYNAKMLKDEVS